VLVALPIALLLWVLPFHAVTIAFFFGVLRTGMQATMIMASWKEGVVVILITVVAMRCVLSRGPGVTIMPTDVAITSLIGTCDGSRPSCSTRASVTSARSTVRVDHRQLQMLYYFGRGVPRSGASDLHQAPVPGRGLVAAIGIIERIFVARMLVAMGAASYMSDFLGLTVSTAGNDWGLPSMLQRADDTLCDAPDPFSPAGRRLPCPFCVDAGGDGVGL
jgi:hypothetical protein